MDAPPPRENMQLEREAEPSLNEITIHFEPEQLRELRKLAGSDDDQAVVNLLAHAVQVYAFLTERAAQGFEEMTLRNPDTDGRIDVRGAVAFKKPK